MTLAQDSLLIRPKRSLLRTGFITFFATTVPLFSALYWYTASTGTWMQVAVTHAALAALGMLLYWRQRNVFAAVSVDALSGNGIFSGTRSVALDEIRTMVFTRIYAGNSLDSSAQLVAIDDRGHCRFRLRGYYWHDAELMQLAKATGSEIDVEDAALTEADFFAKYPKSQYWFEGNRPLRMVAIVGSIIAVVFSALWLMTVMQYGSVT